MSLQSLNDLLVEQLQDLYSAETQLVEALPKMAQAATDPQLKDGFEMHLRQTEQQVQRLEQALQQMGKRPGGITCKGMQGLIAEGEETIKERANADVRDAALIAAAQRVEHYEIAGYGTVATFAEQLGQNDLARLMRQTLREEEETDRKLTMLAEGHINRAAQR